MPMLSQHDRWKPVLVLFLFGSLVGCAGRPPLQQLTLARAGVTAARQADAPQAAREDFNLAEQYLTRAEQALELKRYEEAREWADRTVLAAEAARAKAQGTAAERRVEQVQRSLEQLQQELDRQRSRAEELKRQL
ncbi:MAG: DUF4398 domain-containing protein [Nitrospinae bacterium]|nr:DUF4398 domain-containing protein [Nitrospinota bacterium]